MDRSVIALRSGFFCPPAKEAGILQAMMGKPTLVIEPDRTVRNRALNRVKEPPKLGIPCSKELE